MTFVACVMAIALSGGPELIIAGVLATLVLIGGVVAVVARGRAKARGQLPTADAPQLTGKPNKPEARTREPVDVPVEIDKRMSLAEIKAAKSAVLSSKFKNSDEAQAEITRRKTGGVRRVSSGDDTPVRTERPLAVTPVAPNPVVPGASSEAPTAPQPLQAGENIVAAAARNAVTTQAPAVALGQDDEADSAGESEQADSTAPTAGSPAAVVDETPVAKPVAVVDETPVAKPVAVVDEAPVAKPVAVVDEAPVAKPVAVVDEAPVAKPVAVVDEAPVAKPVAVVAEKPRPVALSDGLAKTRGGLFKRLGTLFTSKQALDEELFEELEELLFTADIGVKTCQYLLQQVQQRQDDGEVADAETAYRVLREEMSAVLHRHTRHLEVPANAGPQVWLMVGVNGAGKTTTVGKLAAQLTEEGKSVLMVAGDTFRAAAVGQLERWAERVGCGFHSGADEADPSSVIFDGVKRAKAEGVDIVLCDTAGRLQTKTPLMAELSKIGRVAGKALDGAPHETILVVDANTGQNAIQQARLFGEAVPLTGMILTKLDGTAKGGVVLGISQELDVPIYHIGIGEGIADLRRFDADEFVEALFL
ncbi:MAG: fused signal recognition particle receptor [Bradymonadia bacterium]|jgi:fused signal recognition particle receptor